MPERLWDEMPDSPHEWQRPELMAERLGVSQRTVRNMVQRGEIQRTRVNGRVYVRQPHRALRVPAPEPIDFTKREDLQPSEERARAGSSTRLEEKLAEQLDVLRREREAEVARLNDKLRASAVEAEWFRSEVEQHKREAQAAAAGVQREKRFLAEEREHRRQDRLARERVEQQLERERAGATAERERLSAEAERQQARAEGEAQRSRLLLRAASLPWWQVRERRRLIEQATLPAALLESDSD